LAYAIEATLSQIAQNCPGLPLRQGIFRFPYLEEENDRKI